MSPKAGRRQAQPLWDERSLIVQSARELDALYRRYLETDAAERQELDARIQELELGIARQPAHSLADAAVQLMIAAAHMEYLRSSASEPQRRSLERGETLVRQVLDWVLKRGGLDLRDLGGHWYTPPDSRAEPGPPDPK